jgi:hypothetical protein
MAVSHHIRNLQVFQSNPVLFHYQLAYHLVPEVLTTVGNVFVLSLQPADGFCTVAAADLPFSHTAQQDSQPVLSFESRDP